MAKAFTVPLFLYPDALKPTEPHASRYTTQQEREKGGGDAAVIYYRAAPICLPLAPHSNTHSTPPYTPHIHTPLSPPSPTQQTNTNTRPRREGGRLPPLPLPKAPFKRKRGVDCLLSLRLRVAKKKEGNRPCEGRSIRKSAAPNIGGVG